MNTTFTISQNGSGPVIGGRGEDLLRFVPTSLGDNTGGTWSMFFDGSSHGLCSSGENIDAVAKLADGRIVISTSGSFLRRWSECSP